MKKETRFDIEDIYHNNFGRGRTQSDVGYTGGSNLTTKQSVGYWLMQDKARLLLLLPAGLFGLVAFLFITSLIFAHPIITGLLCLIIFYGGYKILK